MQKLPHAKVYLVPDKDSKFRHLSPSFEKSNNVDIIQRSPIQSQRNSLNVTHNSNITLPPMVQSPNSKVLNKSFDEKKSVNTVSTDKCIELAKETALNPDAWSALWASSLFCNVFTKLLNTSLSLSKHKSKYNIQSLMQFDPLYVEDNILIDIIGLAIKERDQVCKWMCVLKFYFYNEVFIDIVL